MMCTLLGMMAFFWLDGVMVDCFVNYLLLGMMRFVIMVWTILLGSIPEIATSVSSISVSSRS